MFDLTGKRIWVAGHRGMVGRAIVRALEARGHSDVLTVGREQVDLRDQSAVRRWVTEARPEVVFIAAAKVGGIIANSTKPVDFLYDNLMIEANVIHAAHEADVQKLLFLGSNCIYPVNASQPVQEDTLMTGPVEPTNEWYAVAKIAGLKLCEAYRKQYGRRFISAIPTGLYGPHDNFDPDSGHVLPALLRKIHEAKVAGVGKVVLWGSGKPRRPFMHVDDCASACLFLMERYEEASHINIGVPSDIEIRELARLIAETVGYRGEFVHDLSKPDGAMRKLVDGSKLTAMGWRPSIGFEQGLRETYEWFLTHQGRPQAA
jgi:GDP-L-fucose synthase